MKHIKNIIFLLFVGFVLNIHAQDLSLSGVVEGTNGHEYVDLGLPSGNLWATENLNQGRIEPVGYTWGDITLSGFIFAPDLYAYYLSGNENDGNILLMDIGDNIVATEYDAARLVWGGKWQLPNLEDFNELIEYCRISYVLEDDWIYKSRAILTGPNNNQIYLSLYPLNPPFRFESSDADFEDEENEEIIYCSQYWSGISLPSEAGLNEPSLCAYTLCIENSSIKIADNWPKWEMGFVRPVLKRSESSLNRVVEDMWFAVTNNHHGIHIKGSIEEFVVEIFSSTGSLIMTGNTRDGEFCSGQMNPGLYIVKISHIDGTVKTNKVMIL